jgi:membrane protease YdiL (CAAX protease family)
LAIRHNPRNSEVWVKRLAKFIRSVIPTDPTQLLLLAGAVCLTFSPHLKFWPPAFITQPDYRTQLLIEQTVPLRIFSVWFVMFSGMAAYFVCFWPGSHPIRRILLWVFAPAIVGSGFIVAQTLWLTQQTTSVLQSTRYVAQSVRPSEWARGISLPGFFFCFAGLLLIAIYVSRLAFGIARLPLSLLDNPLSEATDSAAWRRLQWVIWVLVGPLILVSVVLGIFSLPLIFSSRISVYIQTVWFTRLSSVVEGAATLGVLLWIMGKENRQVIWSMTRLPEPRHAALGLSLPIGIAALISTAQYLLVRAQWAAHGFASEVPPTLGSFFNLPDPWLYLLIFSAFFEEMIFRGLLLRRFIDRYGVHRGIILVGIVWAAFHFHSDVSFSRATIAGAFTILGARVAMCLVLNYVLAWLTLRFSSVLPAALAHAFYNVLVFSEFDPPFPGKNALRLGLWAILACILFRYWPVPERQNSAEQSALAAPNPELAV